VTRVFPAETRLEAWLDATRSLLEDGPTLNIILSIASPATEGEAGLAARAILDRFYAAENQPPLHTVAETIFPGWAYRRRGLAGMRKAYGDEYELLKRANPQHWGTYAHRVLFRTTSTGEIVNPLQALIDKMRAELNRPSRGAFRSCYELGIAEGAYDIPLHNTVDDRNLLHGPCLSHLSFKLWKRTVHLTAVYRSHDYRWKVPGNLLGLARMQACVASEIGGAIGTLVVHSTFAYFEHSKGGLREAIAEVGRVMPEKSLIKSG
jgi:thymidylate synthase